MICFRFLIVLCSSFILVLSSEANHHSQVRDVVRETNNYMAKNGLEELPLPGFIDKGSLHELLIKNAKVGNFSEADVKEIHYINLNFVRFVYSTSYSFEVILGLNPLEINYDFELTFNRMIPLRGHVEVAAHTNSYQVRGTAHVLWGHSCEAVLEKCKFKEMKDFEVNIKPKKLSYFREVKKHVLDVMAPHYISKVNNGLADLIVKPEFKRGFSNIVCNGIKSKMSWH